MSEILKQANEFISELDKQDRKEYAEINFEMMFAFSGLSLIASPDIQGRQAARDIVKTHSEALIKEGYKVDTEKLYKHILRLHIQTSKDLFLTDKRFEKIVESYFNHNIWGECIKWESEGSECRKD